MDIFYQSHIPLFRHDQLPVRTVSKSPKSLIADWVFLNASSIDIWILFINSFSVPHHSYPLIYLRHYSSRFIGTHKTSEGWWLEACLHLMDISMIKIMIKINVPFQYTLTENIDYKCGKDGWFQMSIKIIKIAWFYWHHSWHLTRFWNHTLVITMKISTFPAISAT